MSTLKVKFNKAGKWADHPADPIFEVTEGEIVEVSLSLAKVVVDSGNGEIVDSGKAKEPEPEPEPEKEPEPVMTSNKGKRGKK